MKRANIDGENLYILWTTWGILMMTFSEKIWPVIILKLKLKKQAGPHSFFKNIFLKKPGGKCKTEPPAF